MPDMIMNTLRPSQNGRHFTDDVFKCIFLNENVWILLKLSLKFVPKGPINNIPSRVQVMTWRRQGDKPISGPMMVSLLTHICVAQPQWVNLQVPSLQETWRREDSQKTHREEQVSRPTERHTESTTITYGSTDSLTDIVGGVLTHSNLTLFYWSRPEDIRTIEEFMAHIYVNKAMEYIWVWYAGS